MSKEVKTAFDKYQNTDKPRRKEKPITISVNGTNSHLEDEAVIEGAIDDLNLIFEAFADKLVGDGDALPDVYLEPYRNTLAVMVDNFDGVIDDDAIDNLRIEARQILCYLAEGLQETHEWFLYSYRLVETVKRFGRRDVEYLITMKKDRRILSLSDFDTEDIERKFSQLINRLLQLT